MGNPALEAKGPKHEKFTVKVIGPLGDPPSSFCPVGPNLFGFSGDVFREERP